MLALEMLAWAENMIASHMVPTQHKLAVREGLIKGASSQPVILASAAAQADRQKEAT